MHAGASLSEGGWRELSNELEPPLGGGSGELCDRSCRPQDGVDAAKSDHSNFLLAGPPSGGLLLLWAGDARRRPQDLDCSHSPAEARMVRRPEVRFCTSFDGTQIAAGQSGSGSPTLVRAATWLTHIEHAPPGSFNAGLIDAFARHG